jgi:hypothetical protein
MSDKIIIVKDKKRGEGYNTQEAVVNRCPQKSIILLLDFD